MVQQVLCTLGRLDQLAAKGATDTIMRSLARYARRERLVDGYRGGDLEAGVVRQLEPNLVWGRLWQGTGIQLVVTELL